MVSIPTKNKPKSGDLVKVKGGLRNRKSDFTAVLKKKVGKTSLRYRRSKELWEVQPLTASDRYKSKQNLKS